MENYWQYWEIILAPTMFYLYLKIERLTKTSIVTQKEMEVMSKLVSSIDNRLNLFLKTELDTLKEIAESVTKKGSQSA